MRVNIFTRYTAYLEGPEMFQAETPTGPITVRMIMAPADFEQSNEVTLRGFGIKKDGTAASIQRNTKYPFTRLPQHMQDSLLEAKNPARRVTAP